MLGEFGGLNGREMKAWNGVGLPEKEEKNFLNSEEGNREVPGVGMLWNWDLSPRCPGLSSSALSSLELEGAKEENRGVFLGLGLPGREEVEVLVSGWIPEEKKRVLSRWESLGGGLFWGCFGPGFSSSPPLN